MLIVSKNKNKFVDLQENNICLVSLQSNCYQRKMPFDVLLKVKL
jgi:hypothetical protein